MAILDTLKERIDAFTQEQKNLRRAADEEIAALQGSIDLMQRAVATLDARPELATLYDNLAALNILPPPRKEK